MLVSAVLLERCSRVAHVEWQKERGGRKLIVQQAESKARRLLETKKNIRKRRETSEKNDA
jgi:hypothetical protein